MDEFFTPALMAIAVVLLVRIDSKLQLLCDSEYLVRDRLRSQSNHYRTLQQQAFKIYQQARETANNESDQ